MRNHYLFFIFWFVSCNAVFNTTTEIYSEVNVDVRIE